MEKSAISVVHIENMTHRFTVNLPRNQKMVNRISPAMPLSELFHKVCQEKNLNPANYQFQHTQQPGMRLDLGKMTVGDLKCNEVNFVNCAMMDSAQSMTDLNRSESARREQPTSYMPGAAEPKKKRGFLSFLKKDKKFKLNETEQRLEAQMHANSQQSSSKSGPRPLTPPAERRNAGNIDATQGVRPKSMFVSSKPSELENGHIGVSKETTLPRVPPRTGKKRQAPLPPQQNPTPAPQPQTVEVVIKDQNQESNKGERRVSKATEGKTGQDTITQRLHSRNSSDSSGYHELTLSGAESPEAGRVKSTFKTSIDTTSIESVDNNNDSGITDISSHNTKLSTNQMSAGDSQTLPSKSAIPKPPRQRSHSLERNQEQPTQIKPSAKKKRAPAPPQPSVSVKPLPTHEEAPSIIENTSQNDQPIREPESDITQLPEQVEISTSQNDVVDNIDGVTLNYDEDQDDASHDVLDVDMSHDDRDLSYNGQDMSHDEHDISNGMMAERASLCSEDIDNILVADPKPMRPCSFIAPPPPLEPPPDLIQDNEKKYVDKGVVVNDDNASLPSASVKGSPSSNPGYKNEMAMFVENMSNLTVGSDNGSTNQSGSVTPTMQDTEESETGSVINHQASASDPDTESYTESEVSTQSDLDRREQERQARLSSIFSNNTDQWEDTPSPPRLTEEPKKIGHAINQKLLSPDADNPINFDFTPPTEFQNDSVVTELRYDEPQMSTAQNKNNNSKNYASDEEEWTETVEEVVYHLGPKSSYTFGGALKNIPDTETKRELDSSRSTSTVSAFTLYQEPKSKISQRTTPVVKEEFVLTTNDLAKVNFVASPPMSNKTSKSSYLNGRPTGYSSNTHNLDKGNNSYQANIRSERSYSPDVVRDNSDRHSGSFSLPVMRETQHSPSPVNVFTSSSSLNMAAPRELTPSGWVVKSEPKEISSSYQYTEKSSDNLSPKHQVATSTYSRLLTPSGWQAAPSSDENSPSNSPSVSPSISDSIEESKVAQYEQLEEQLKQWQEQLKVNENILASQQFSAENQSLQAQMQSQIEMQKQMMEQLQKSMSALTKDIPANKHAPTPPPAPTPIPPPAPQPAFQLKKVSATNRPPPKRFEPQLDPREELMIAIRSFGGRNSLEKVAVQNTNWK
ncbi:hypothetical protein LOTGIDRAFT_172258 [Lottia gigantea]|uniref:Cordon-bleu ubiquitin-like domain-containing protein n=1 Tax=Lottia gigantea TaxID=225164 RepID=V4AE11_LOTGI|nr:hypothetical protein LOTGIDRAFT_172258 [Lottia gigantea]ESP02259.1 hypothetical protein LOTGIDRAFT_172258 [Lottia gigantea]